MNDSANDRAGPMLNSPYLGELIRDSMDEMGWNANETVTRLGCECGTLWRRDRAAAERRAGALHA